MRRFTVLAGIVLLVLAMVPLASAAPAPAARSVAGNILTGAGDIKGMALFEVRTSPSGELQFGYYQSEQLAGPEWWAPGRTKATVDNVTFFKAESGAQAARFGGVECSLLSPDPDVIGTCGEYATIVTDGASIGTPDTFCGGPPDDPCRYVGEVTGGDIAIYGLP